MSGGEGVNIYSPKTLMANWYSDRLEKSWRDQEAKRGTVIVSRKFTSTNLDYGHELPPFERKLPELNYLSYEKEIPKEKYRSSFTRGFEDPSVQVSPFKCPFPMPEKKIPIYKPP